MCVGAEDGRMCKHAMCEGVLLGVWLVCVCAQVLYP